MPPVLFASIFVLVHAKWIKLKKTKYCRYRRFQFLSKYLLSLSGICGCIDPFHVYVNFRSTRYSFTIKFTNQINTVVITLNLLSFSIIFFSFFTQMTRDNALPDCDCYKEKEINWKIPSAKRGKEHGRGQHHCWKRIELKWIRKEFTTFSIIP